MSIDAPTVPTVVVAFSGGVDSSLALYLAKESVGPENVKVLTSPGFASHSIPSGPLPIPRSTDQAFLQAVIGISPSLSATQHERAKHVASVLGVRLQEIATEEGSVEGYVRNEGDACYYCKTELYSRLKAVGEAVIGGAAREDKEVGRATVIVNGTNADDLR